MTAASSTGRSMRRLGYEVSARAGRPWSPTRRDRLELAAFARDVRDALGKTIQEDPSHPDFVAAIELAAENPAAWAVQVTPEVQCCEECHFAYEEREAFPHLHARDRAVLTREHSDILAGDYKYAVRRHAMREMDMFREAGVPRRVIEAIEADHRRLL